MKFFFSIFLLITTTGFAQQNKNFFYTYATGEKFVVVPNLVLQIAPSLGAATGDTISFGTPVNVLLQVPYSEVIDDYEIPWLKISYKKGDFTKVGFVLAHKLSIKNATIDKINYALAWQGKDTFNINYNNYKDSSITNYSDDFYVLNILNNQEKYSIGLPQNFKIDSVVFCYDKTKSKQHPSTATVCFVQTNPSIQILYSYATCNNGLMVFPPLFRTNSTTSSTNETLFFPTKGKYKKNHFAITKEIIVAKENKQTITSYYEFKNCSYTLIPSKK